MTSFCEDHVTCPAAPDPTAAANLRGNINALLDTLAGTPLARFVAATLEAPEPDPSTGLMPDDRLDVIARRLRATGLTGDLEAVASCLARGGWDTWIEEIAPLLRADRENTLAALDSAARLRLTLWRLAACGAPAAE
jgi:hypothetical protein